MNSVYGFKPKTEFNTELSHFIEENQEQYTSIEMIRINLKELLTDRGMFRFRKILTSGTKRVCQVNCVSFFENCNLVGATPTKLKKAARSVEVI